MPPPARRQSHPLVLKSEPFERGRMKILVVTVGGSFEPLLTAIRAIRPDRVIFVCSAGTRDQVDGHGAPCMTRRTLKESESVAVNIAGARAVVAVKAITDSCDRKVTVSSGDPRPSIINQLASLDVVIDFNADRDVVLVADADDLSEVYGTCVRVLRLILETIKGAVVSADYTGGTKTMSAGLMLAALDAGADLYVTSGDRRRDIIRVESGEVTARVPVARTVFERYVFFDAPRSFEQYAYAPLIQGIQGMLTMWEIASQEKRNLQSLLDLSRGLDAWDRFDHKEAWDCLDRVANTEAAVRLKLWLKRVMTSRTSMDPGFRAPATMKCDGYEIVHDLLLNAERRTVNARYDDAVARLYRAVELTAQIRLKEKWTIDTSNVNTALLPPGCNASLPAQNGDEYVQIGLWKSWLLIECLSDTEFAPVFARWKDRLLGALGARNRSFGAHGFTPVGVEEYRKVGDVLRTFLSECLSTLGARSAPPVQFPKTHFELLEDFSR